MHERRSLYRHSGAGLLRAAVLPVGAGLTGWPDLTDAAASHAWLVEAWALPGFADAVRQASFALAERVDHIVAGGRCDAEQQRRAAASVVRYLLRAIGRPTPFGLFAGVAATRVGRSVEVRWGSEHRAVARCDTLWLSEIVDRLEDDAELLDHLNVVRNNLAVRRGKRWEAFHGPDRVSVRWTAAVASVHDMAAAPIQFATLVEKLADAHRAADRAPVRAMLSDLVRQGFLRTSLRAPMTVVDPLAYVIDRLRAMEPEVGRAATIAHDLASVAKQIQTHNDPQTTAATRAEIRAALSIRMADICAEGRTPLAVDLLLDCDVQIPEQVIDDLERAASVLVRLQRPLDDAGWRSYHAAFLDRYGTGTLVPIRDVVDQDAGLGYPAAYLGSVFAPTTSGVYPRDEQLLTLAWCAVMVGDTEITLSDRQVEALTGDWFHERRVPAHVEIAARLHAVSTQAVQRGDYLLGVGLARAAGTLTSRFTASGVGGGLARVYRTVPTSTKGALPVQLSFRPMFPHSENICRIPVYLPHVLSLDDRPTAGAESIDLGDVAVTATHDRLYLVSVSRQRVIEPQVFHALAVEKQTPPLVRFLAHLDRAFTPVCREFDWGPHAARMPYLPRVRYGRTILASARWRLAAADLPDPSDRNRWLAALSDWRTLWRCPDIVELRDDDRTLRLTLTIPAHVEILRTHLAKETHATFTEAATDADLGWLDGHAHEIAITLATTRTPAPALPTSSMPTVTNRTYGHIPASTQTTWLYAKIFTHPERLDEIITTHLPNLIRALDRDPLYWFIRYRSPQETDHLRLRIRVADAHHYTACAHILGDWMELLRDKGVAGRLVLDTYYPEIGRYGAGDAMPIAEAVFAADSRAVAAALRCLPATAVAPITLTVMNMIDIAERFLGGRAAAMRWLLDQTAPSAGTSNRSTADLVARTAATSALRDLHAWPAELLNAWQDRSAALAAYRLVCTAADMNVVLASLLHMHHNRALGIDAKSEAGCLRLARRVALTWLAQQDGSRHV
jgi:lantibiotic biosynthesis protein